MTDASNFAIGGILSQDKKPILSYLERFWRELEENYGANEKEILPIV